MGDVTPRSAILQDALKRRQSMPPRQTLLTVNEAVSMLRISKWTLYRYIQRNELPSVKFGKRRLFREPDLMVFIDEHQAEALA